jgi:hypothetical protein
MNDRLLVIERADVERRGVHLLYYLEDKPGQVPLGQPVAHRHGIKKVGHGRHPNNGTPLPIIESGAISPNLR